MAQLTEKELSMIEDQLSAEMLLEAKFKSYAQEVSDPQLKAKCEQMAGKHKNHYERLLTLLQ